MLRVSLREVLKNSKRVLRSSDQFKIRDVTEKMWNAIINAINALIPYYLDIVSASYREKRRLLERLGNIDPRIEELSLRDRYGAREISI
jgi:hypothetical protein